MLFFCFLLTLFFLHQSVEKISHSLSDYCIKFFIALVACIIPSGYLLSEFQLIGQANAWSITTFFAEIFWFFTRKKTIAKKIELPKFKTIYAELHRLPISEKLIFGILGGTLLLISIINLIIVFVSVPNEWDSMTGHLVKCAYYLQNGHISRIDGTIWSIDYYPNSLPTLQIYFYHLFQSEKGFQAIHYLSYWVFPIAIYGICKHLGQTRKASSFVFLVASLLPCALVQATTTETDLVFTTYLACVVYFLLIRHKGTKAQSGQSSVLNSEQSEIRNPKSEINISHISYLGLAAAIWISHKPTFILVSPSLGLLVLFCLWRLPIRKFLALAGLFLVFCAIYVLPNGYWANMKAEGKISPSSLTAPKFVMSYHSTEPYTKREILKHGTKNVFRYGFDFMNLDGIRNVEIGEKLNNLIREIPARLTRSLNLEENTFWVVRSFQFSPKFVYHRERPYWGLVFFMLFIPACLVFLSKKSKFNIYLLLIIAFIVHFLALSYSAPYDPVKGRYFLNASIWALPLIGHWSFDNNRKLKNVYLFFVCILVSMTAFGIVVFRANYPITSIKGQSIFNMNRLEMMCQLRPDLYPSFKNFEQLVPENAKVALALMPDDFEYPFFGKTLKRQLFPIHPHNKGLKPIPKEADFLVYTEGVMPLHSGDIQLNSQDKNNDTPMPENTFYLRRLK